MATVSLSLCSICRAPNPNFSISTTTYSCSSPIRLRKGHSFNSIRTSYPNLSVSKKKLFTLKKIRSVAEEETVITDQEEESSSTQAEASSAEQAAVSVPVSPSDILTMFFQADGTMSEAAVPSVISALEETDGISDLRVQVLEGIASVELKKQTTVQATGVASNLVEIIQGSGFKLQTLNLSFEDEDVN